MSTPRVRRSHPLRLSLLAAACLAATGAAQAQTTPAPATDDGSIQRVEITGSRIKRIDAEGVSPVQTIRREDIQVTGATTVSQMLNTLTATSTNGSQITDLNGGNTFSPGASQASLRNLGAQSTLVLLNGRRIAMYPLANYQETFSNLDTLPLEAVDRIEILKSGGAAVYGSDAVAGVINIITRNDFRGFQVDASTEHSTTTGKFGEKSGSLTMGFGDWAKDGWNVMGNVDLFKREGFFWTQDLLAHVNQKYRDLSPSFGSPSSYSYPGNIIGQGAIDENACTGPIINGYCYYDRYSRFQAVPESKRVNALLSGNFRINDKATLYSELLFSKVKTDYESAYSLYGSNQGPVTWVNSQTGEGLEFDYMYLPPEHPLNQTGDYAELRYRFVDSGAYDRIDTTQYRFLTGLKGTFGSWDYDTSVGVMGGTTKEKQRGGFSASGFRTTIGDWDPSGAPSADFFNKPGGYRIGETNSPEVLATLFPTYGYEGKTRQYWFDGNLTTDLATYDTGTLRLATGFEVRRESMSITPTNNLLTGDIVGYGVSQSDASRNFGAVYAEMSVPMTKKTEGSFALRVDKYPGFGAHVSPKAGIRYQATSDLLFRGTAETGFRAPNLQESAPSSKTAFQPGIDDPRRCLAAQQLAEDYRTAANNLPPNDPNAQLYLAQADAVEQNECGASVAIFTVNNPKLKPETSRSFTFGTGFQITRDWSATIDYWNITRRNEINLRSVQALLASENSLTPGVVVRGVPEGTFTGEINGTPIDPATYGIHLCADPTYSGAICPDGQLNDSAIRQINQQWENLFSTHTSGIDFSIKGSVPLGGFGRYSTDLDATWTLVYQAYSSERPNPQGGTGANGDNLSRRYGYPEWQINWTHAITTGPVTNSLRWVHASSQSLQGDWDDQTWRTEDCRSYGYEDYQCKIAAYNRWDWDISWKAYKGLAIGAHVTNVFQQRPPIDVRGFDGITPYSNEDAAGRKLKVWLSYKF